MCCQCKKNALRNLWAAIPEDVEVHSGRGWQGVCLDLCAWLQGTKMRNIGKTYKSISNVGETSTNRCTNSDTMLKNVEKR